MMQHSRDRNSISFDKITGLTKDGLKKVSSLFPDDELKSKRQSNLKKSFYILLAKDNLDVVGVFFARKILFIPNATWVVAQSHRRQHIALHLIEKSKKDISLITAICRNEESLLLAKKANFIVLPFRITVWIKYICR